MDGVHDLGGVAGFGAVDRVRDEPVFRAAWEGRVHGMVLALAAGGRWTIDEFRHAIERMDPAHYLASSYYEHWLDALARIAVEKGLLRADDLAAAAKRGRASRPRPPRRSRARPGKSTPDPLAEALAAGIGIGAPSVRPYEVPPRFGAGDAVVVRRMHPRGHTRCPRYVRGARGIVERHHGAHVLPDSSAHGDPSRADHLYTVAFEAAELWGEGEGRVHVDLWECYLAAAG
ncbi:MAG: nitrile hydratase subunit beta [Candidatus Binatia bacterium]